MSSRLGLSSGSAPRLTAAEFARLTRAALGEVVDLRAGKGHAWEDEGIEGLDGLPVAFVGISVVLGRPGQDTAAANRFAGHAIKVFADAGALAATSTARQFAELVRGREAEQVLVETHFGYAAIDELLRLCDRYGCRLVLDNQGLAQIGADVRSEEARLLTRTAAIQVKGFTLPSDPNERPRHRALDCEDLGWLAPFASTGVDITVESRAGVPQADLQVLRRVWKDFR